VSSKMGCSTVLEEAGIEIVGAKGNVDDIIKNC